MAHENPHRLQPARAKQRDELISRDQKRDEINASERALKAQPAQPKFGREMHSRTPMQSSASLRVTHTVVSGAHSPPRASCVMRPTCAVAGRAVLYPPN